MSRRLWLVRHASTDWSGIRWCGATDLGLNLRGRVEAEALAVRASARIPADARLLTSPLRRAVETADRLGSATGSTTRTDHRLREVDFGAVEGLDWPEMEARFPDVAAVVAAGERSIDWPDGESALQVRARATDVWREVASGPDEVVIVSHGGFIRALLDVAVADTWELPLAPASVVELERRGEGWVVAG